MVMLPVDSARVIRRSRQKLTMCLSMLFFLLGHMKVLPSRWVLKCEFMVRSVGVPVLGDFS